jgi:hypothetical protein
MSQFRASFSVLLQQDLLRAEDPFRGLLDGEGLPPGPTAIESDSLSVADMHNLMACICNGHLQPDVRCSAANQLHALALLPDHRAAIAVPSFLEACLRQIERAVGVVYGSAAEASAVGDASVAADPAPLSIFQMQLPVACLQLLGTLCTCSGGVLVCFAH